eukprot:7138842-Prymnesium_polylepis.2
MAYAWETLDPAAPGDRIGYNILYSTAVKPENRTGAERGGPRAARRPAAACIALRNDVRSKAVKTKVPG